MGVALLVAVVWSCSSDRHQDESAPSSTTGLSDATLAARDTLASLGPGLREAARLNASSATFEQRGSALAVVAPRSNNTAIRRATVRLPVRAAGRVYVEDEASGLAVSFRLAGAADVTVGIAEGLAIYPRGGPEGAHVLHRAHAEGIEDHVAFERKPSVEELRYTVDVRHAAGLRLTGNMIELLDAAGAPRLRVAPPSVVDATGRESAATLGIEGCAFDADPRGPWGRAVTAPGSNECVVRVRWRDVTYPAVVDPDWSTTGSLPMDWRLNRHSASVLASGRVLVTGGYAFCINNVCKSSWLYDPATATWSATGFLATQRMHHTATVLLSGKVLIVGGFDYSASPVQAVASAELYDPALGTWSDAGSLGTGRGNGTASLVPSGKVLVAGGQTGTIFDPGSADPYRSIASAELYDPATGAWSPTGSMSGLRQAHTAVVLASGKVLVAGGSDRLAGTFASSAELYDPVLGTWSMTAAMSVARASHTAAPLPGGRVLVAGGRDNTGQDVHYSSAEIYDPITGVWSNTGSMLRARFNNTASPLLNGTVLVTGGSPAGTEKSAELYDPISGGWSPTDGSMAFGRHFHTASVLLNGKVLVVGGVQAGDGNAVELFAVAPPIPCTFAAQCSNGFCVDGVCCNTACTGVCQACTSALRGGGSDGLCGPIAKGLDPENECKDDGAPACTKSSVCDGAGACAPYAKSAGCPDADSSAPPSPLDGGAPPSSAASPPPDAEVVGSSCSVAMSRAAVTPRGGVGLLVALLMLRLRKRPQAPSRGALDPYR